MVDPRFIRLLQTTDRTSLGVFFNYFRFGGYAGNKEHSERSQFRVLRPLFSFTVIITLLAKNLQLSKSCQIRY